MSTHWTRQTAALLVVLALSSGLAGQAAASHEDEAHESPVPVAGPVPAAAPPTPRVVFLGDSITFGSFVGRVNAYPAVLGRRLAEEGHPIRVVNAGVHGNTAAAGMNRLYALAKAPIDILVLELGGNDGLRGWSLETVESSLRDMIRAAAAEYVPVLLLGMRVPEALGADYARDFAALYDRLAAEEGGVAYVPFFMEQAVAHAEGMHVDGIHPTALGHQLIAEEVLPELQELVEAWESEVGLDAVSDDCVVIADLRHFAASLEEEGLVDPAAREQLLKVFVKTTGFRKQWGLYIDKGLIHFGECNSTSSWVESLDEPMLIHRHAPTPMTLSDGTVTQLLIGVEPVVIENRTTLAHVLFDHGVYPMSEAPCGDGEPFHALVGLGNGRMAVLRWPSRTWGVWAVQDRSATRPADPQR